MNIFGQIYGLFAPDGELRYVGKTSKEIDVRLREHLKEKGKSYRCKWLNKLKINLKLPIIQLIQAFENITAEDLNKAEIYWIKYFKDQGCRLVNGTSGGDGLINPTSEVRVRMSKSHLGQRLLLGKKASTEAKKNMSIAQKRLYAEGYTPPFKNKTHSPETCKKLSDLGKNRPVSEETKLKLSIILTGRKGVSPTEIQRIKISRKLGAKAIKDQFGNVYQTQTLAAKAIGTSQANICAMLKGRRAHVKGFVFVEI